MVTKTLDKTASLKLKKCEFPVVSIIVPVYNTEQYLSKCLDSIINQTYKNLEIICVNDGSTDNSAEILNEYAKKNSRIKVLTQENQGVSKARNLGLNNTAGGGVCPLCRFRRLA